MQQLKFGITNQFTPVFTTRGTGASAAVFYRPIPAEEYYLIGDYGQGNFDPVVGTIVTVSVIDPDPDDPMLVPPDDFQLIWNGNSAGIEGSFWRPVAPPNYVALGAVAQFGINKPTLGNYRCLRFDQVKAGNLGGLIWSNGGSAPASVYQIVGTNAFFAQATQNPPVAPVYVPKEL